MADKLITTRNLVDGYLGPLRRFTAVLDSMPTEVRTFGEGDSARPRTYVTLNFKQLEVVEAAEPYNFPTYSTRPMALSNQLKSTWGVLANSFNDLVDKSVYSKEQLDPANPAYVKPKDRTDIESCIGKRFGMVLADGEEGRPQPPLLYDGRTSEDKPTPAWMVYSVEGIGVAGAQGKSPTDIAIDLLNGKTLAEFNTKALANPSIQGDANLLKSISQPESSAANFANTLVTAGKFTKDENNVYHKV